MVTYVQILRPEFQSTVNGSRIIPQLSDYITTPRLSTHGVWKTVDLLPFETLAALSIFRDGMSNKYPALNREVTNIVDLKRKKAKR